MNFILFDDRFRSKLLPLTYTRPIADIRMGILTLREKWEFILQLKTSTLTQAYLSVKFPLLVENDNILINGGIEADFDLLRKIEALHQGQVLVKDDTLIAARLDKQATENFDKAGYHAFDKVVYERAITHLKATWEIFSKNGESIQKDFDLLTKDRKSAPISKTNQVLGNQIFAEESAIAECSIFNSQSGPIYLGHHSEVMEGSVVRGALALCDHASLKLSTKIYGPTTVGPYSKVGGEVNNSVLLGYSNKGHDGFLGNSVLGEWCNLGADTNNSNLKNNYAEVKLWDYDSGRFAKTGLKFCGLIMGDHSKSGINTMFNTGTVVGVSANIFGSGFPRNFVPSFSWGGSAGFETFMLSKVFEVAERVMERRNIPLTQTDKDMLTHVFNESAVHRYWEQ